MAEAGGQSGSRTGGERQLAAGLAGWLGLAAAPTFAAMALATMLDGGDAAYCPALPDGTPLNGMATMYLLMAVFHAAPWLRRGRGGLRCEPGGPPAT